MLPSTAIFLQSIFTPLPPIPTAKFPHKIAQQTQKNAFFWVPANSLSLDNPLLPQNFLVMEEVGLGSTKKIGFSPCRRSLVAPLEKFQAKVIGFLKKVKKIGEDDPRRILHSLKVGLALTLVSILYYVNPLFDSFGTSTMWAVLTVVVVMEYTVGGTLSKGLNRAFATLLAGALALGAHYIAILSGERGEPILLVIFVFLLASAATFSRFIPEIKARYDYGVIIFILTFSLVAVSSYRVEEVIQMAHQRLSTIAIGVATCLCTSIFVFPVWAGQDVHKLAAANLEKLASFLEGLGAECFTELGGENLENKSFIRSYKSVLNSKPTEDALTNFARWEPGHGKFGFRYPWSQYLKVGALARQCAYSMEVLTAFLATSDEPTRTSNPETTTEPEIRRKIRSTCAELSSESGNALKELALAIRTMTSPSSAHQHITVATTAAEKFRAVLASGGTLADVQHAATTASLLVEMVWHVQNIAVAVDELARLAHFKSPEALNKAAVKPIAEGESPLHVAIDVKN